MLEQNLGSLPSEGNCLSTYIFNLTVIYQSTILSVLDDVCHPRGRTDSQLYVTAINNDIDN
jgi:hypothetical protein